MASSYTTKLRLELQGTGENLNTWGIRNNNSVISLVDDAVAGVVSFSLSGTKVLTSANGSTDEARKAVLNITSGTGGTITIPSVSKMYLVRNASTGDVILTTGVGLTATVPASDSNIVFSDGTNVYLARDYNYAGNRITGVGTPSSSTDASNKAYSDNILVQANTYTDTVASASGNLPNQTGNAGKVVTTNGTVASWATVSSVGALTVANNLADLGNVVTARASLGLGNSAVLNVGTAVNTVAAGDDARINGAAQKSLNLSDLISASSARSNLGLGTVATQSIVPVSMGGTGGTSAAIARSNLGLGTAAVQNVGAFLQSANNLSDLSSLASGLSNLGLVASLGGIFGNTNITIPVNVGGTVINMIIKLGYEATVSADTTRSFNFATAFPNACVGVFPVTRVSSFDSGADSWAQLVGTPTRFGGTFANQRANGSATIDIPYIAVGY